MLIISGIAATLVFAIALVAPLAVTDRGVIEAGKLADIIAIKGNPLDDVSLLGDVSFVMKNGRRY